MKNKKVIKKETGYYQLKEKPIKEELDNYYSNKYYQESQGSYETEYSDAEIKYIKSKQRYLHYCCEKILGGGKSFLDVGCGEGWSLSYFKSIGCNVKGVDFSSFGIEKFNPEVIGFFVKSDIYEFLQNEITTSNRYDIINLTNVIEHVLHPEELLANLKNILSNDGIIIVTFPNDFSKFQYLLYDLGKIEEEFWIVSPDHISYFTKDSFSNMAKSLGFSIELVLADFPIDLFLINDYSNYIRDKSKGKQAHYSRVQTMNLLYDLDFELSAEAFLNLGAMGFGRDLTAFMKIKESN